jgi:hypothetical protein
MAEYPEVKGLFFAKLDQLADDDILPRCTCGG